MTISELAIPDSGKNYISTGKEDQINAFYVPDLQYTVLGKFIIYRLMEDRDVKILITGKGKTTGTGKTTLGIHLAHFVNNVRNYLFDKDTEWTSQEYSFMNVWDYLRSYKESEKGTPLITDELEYLADRRNHATHENKKFSQAWSVLRYKNVVTIGTAPGLSDLEKRIPEGADIWLNVVQKGKANSYYLTFHDFDQSRIFKRLRLGEYRESILWNPIEDSEDYQWLKEKKEEIGVPGVDDMGQKIDQTDLNKLEKNIRNQFVKEMFDILKEGGLYNSDTGRFEGITQTELADRTGVSQAQISKIKRRMEKEGEL